jgi:hypothetical protein
VVSWNIFRASLTVFVVRYVPPTSTCHSTTIPAPTPLPCRAYGGIDRRPFCLSYRSALHTSPQSDHTTAFDNRWLSLRACGFGKALFAGNSNRGVHVDFCGNTRWSLSPLCQSKAISYPRRALASELGDINGPHLAHHFLLVDSCLHPAVVCTHLHLPLSPVLIFSSDLCALEATAETMSLVCLQSRSHSR